MELVSGKPSTMWPELGTKFIAKIVESKAFITRPVVILRKHHSFMAPVDDQIEPREKDVALTRFHNLWKLHRAIHANGLEQ